MGCLLTANQGRAYIVHPGWCLMWPIRSFYKVHNRLIYKAKTKGTQRLAQTTFIWPPFPDYRFIPQQTDLYVRSQDTDHWRKLFYVTCTWPSPESWHGASKYSTLEGYNQVDHGTQFAGNNPGFWLVQSLNIYNHNFKQQNLFTCLILIPKDWTATHI